LTATLSKLSLNITSAHVATFGERAVDVFYVTDLFGAKIESQTRHATIKRALLNVLNPADAAKPAKVAATA
jgi:[protein-PII] uridylyltransferase